MRSQSRPKELQMTKSWRGTLAIHPAAELFPLMPPAELRELADDIRKNGRLTSPIALLVDDPQGRTCQLLDGRNRLDALELAGITFEIERDGRGRWHLNADEIDPPDPVIISHPDEALQYVISVNIRRRHLSNKKKRELIAKLIKADPSKSDRQIGKMIKADNKTVASVRAQKEAREEIPHVPTRYDAKGRRQPASKGNKSRVSVPQPTAAETPNRTDKISFGGLGEVEHLPVQNMELQNTSPELEPEKSAPRSDALLRGPTTEEPDAEASELNDLLGAWDRARETVRRAFAARVGLQRSDVP
jgi:hypothetical protein